MPLVIFEGPEASGKSTLIDALRDEWGLDKSVLRSWGPRESWLEYCGPLFEDLKECKEYPQRLIVWSRSWISRTVYNRLLSQGQNVPTRATLELDNIVIASGGLLIMMDTSAGTLIERRAIRRLDSNAKPDHELDPVKERNEFMNVIRSRKWKVLSGLVPPEDNVRSIISMLVNKNPECRMDVASGGPRVDLSSLSGYEVGKEEPIAVGYDVVS